LSQQYYFLSHCYQESFQPAWLVNAQNAPVGVRALWTDVPMTITARVATIATITVNVAGAVTHGTCAQPNSYEMKNEHALAVKSRECFFFGVI
jgi:hypothetical protein